MEEKLQGQPPEYNEYKPGIMFSKKVRIIIFVVCIAIISVAVFIATI
jgi:hypothetical protein